MPGLGTGVDDFPAVALFFKGVDGRLNAPDDAFDVDVIDLIDGLLDDRFDRRRRGDAGIVDDNVETAQRCTRLFDGGENLFTARDVYLKRQRPGPPCWLISAATAFAAVSL